MSLRVNKPSIDKPLANGHGHYYDKAGNLISSVPMVTSPDELRPTNMTDCRKLKLYPGTTSITRLASQFKPDISPFIKAAMELGTEIHKALEMMVFSSYSPMHSRACMGVRGWYDDHGIDWRDVVPESTIDAGRCGYGGSIDAIVTDKDGQEYIIDYKTCKTNRKKLYPPLNYKMQITAYKKAKEMEYLKYKNAKKVILYVSTDKPGDVYSEEIKEEELYWDTFKHCYRAYVCINKLEHLRETELFLGTI